MKIVTLVENSASRADLKAEHGLSLYIETETHKILFDAGQSEAFAENARKLGVDLEAVDLAVLSHGHYDHGGGLARFLEINKTAPIYISRYAFERHCNASGKDIGLDPLLQKNDRLIFTDGKMKLAPGLMLCSLPLPPADTGGMTAEVQGMKSPEDFRHEQYLLAEEGGKRILFSGCSHKGILQIMAYFQPDILVGGFHFMKIGEEAWLRQAAEELLQYPTRYYTGHCTGQTQFACMKGSMGERLQALSTGSMVEI